MRNTTQTFRACSKALFEVNSWTRRSSCAAADESDERVVSAREIQHWKLLVLRQIISPSGSARVVIVSLKHNNKEAEREQAAKWMELL